MEQKQQSFISKAKREQEAINWLCKIKDITNEKTTNPYECFDNYIFSGGSRFIVEIKVRTNYSYEDIKLMGGSYLQFDKIESIRGFKEANVLNDKILYINFYRDCVVIYQIHTSMNRYEWKLEYLQKNDYDKTKEYKFLTELNEDDINEVIYYKHIPTK